MRALLCLLAAAATSLAMTGAPRARPSSSVTLVAAGDILLDRGVGRRIARHGAAYPFSRAAADLRRTDLAFGNLECPISAEGRPVPKPFSFRAHPRAAVGLTYAGFDVLSIANNHALDCGRAGLTDTLAYLRDSGIASCGAGPNLAGAEAPAILVRNGLRVAFVGFCDVVQDASFPRHDAPGVAGASPEAIRRAVGSAARRADIVVASFHWGIEYYTRPTERQRMLARCAARAGADVVFGHHPHVLQGIERVPGRRGRTALVAYSLGNFVFDPLRSPAQATMLLEVQLTAHGAGTVRILPYVIRDCRPEPARGADALAIRRRVEALSNEMELPRTRRRAAAPGTSGGDHGRSPVTPTRR
jgi:poly-gamma-glutamate synthesis protein (capsule biosynthesis protein)